LKTKDDSKAGINCRHIYQPNRRSRIQHIFWGNQAARPISTGKLHALPHFHTQPINLVVFEGSSGA